MFVYELLDVLGNVIEKRAYKNQVDVGPGSYGEFTRMRLAAIQPEVPIEVSIVDIQDIYTALVDKGILTKQDITAAKTKRPK